MSAVLVTVTGTAISYVINVALQSLMGRVGGPVALGHYTARFGLVQGVATIMVAGTPSGLTREVSSLIAVGKSADARRLLVSVLCALIGAGVIINGFLLVFFEYFQRLGIFTESLQRTGLLWIVGGALGLSISTLIKGFYEAVFKNGTARAIVVVGPIVTFLLILLSTRSIDPLNISVALGVGYVVQAVVGLLSLIRDRSLRARPSAERLGYLLSFSLPLFGVSVLAFLSAWLDRILAGMTGGAGHIGLLTSAVVIARSIRFIPQALSPVFVTAYSRFDSSDFGKIASVFSTDLFVVGLFCIGSAAATYIWAPFISRTLWGDQFGDLTIMLIRIETLGLIGLAYSTQTPNFLIAIGRPKVNFWLASIHVTLQFVVSLVLGKLLGIIGLAIATSLTMIFMSLVRHSYLCFGLGANIEYRNVLALVFVFLMVAASYHLLECSNVFPSLGASLGASALLVGSLVLVALANRSTLKGLVDAFRQQMVPSSWLR